VKLAYLETSFSARIYKNFVVEMRKHFELDWLVVDADLRHHFEKNGFSPIYLDIKKLQNDYLALSDKELLSRLSSYREKWNISSFRSFFLASNAYETGTIYNSYHDRKFWSYTLALIDVFNEYLVTEKPSMVFQNFGAEMERRILKLLCDQHNIKSVFMDYVPFYVGVQPSRNEFSSCYNVSLRNVTGEAAEQHISDYKKGEKGYHQWIMPQGSNILEKIGNLVAYSNKSKKIFGYFETKIANAYFRQRSKIIDSICALKRKNVPSHMKMILYPFQTVAESQATVRSFGICDQLYIIRQISIHMPENYVLLVKLHPHDLRGKDFKTIFQLFRLKDVVVVPSNAPIAEILSATNVVITMNSTVGFEALTYGIPVITLGTSIYRGMGLTIDITELNAIGDAISEAEDFKTDTSRVEAMVAKWLSNAFRGDIGGDCVEFVQDIKAFIEKQCSDQH